MRKCFALLSAIIAIHPCPSPGQIPAAPAAAAIPPPPAAVAPPAPGTATAAGDPAPRPDPADADTLAFGDEQTRMTVPVSIAANGPYAFIVDTGAERTVVSRQLAARLGLASGPSVRLTAMADVVQVSTVLVPALSVSRIVHSTIEAPMLEMRNLGAAGMLGIDALQGHAVLIDFDLKRMTVTSAKRRPASFRADPGDIVVRARNLYGQLIVTDARYRGKRISVVIDTGSSISVANGAMRALIPHPEPLGTISLLSATGAWLTADYGVVDLLHIGGIGFEHVPLAFADAKPFARFGLTGTPALLLGMDTLRLFRRVQIDFANREVRFTLPRFDGATITGI